MKGLIRFNHFTSLNREAFGLCDGLRHWDVEVMKYDDDTYRCSISNDGRCQLMECGKGKLVMDVASLPRRVQDTFNLQVPVPPGQVLVSPIDDEPIIKILSGGDMVRPYWLEDGRLLQDGESIFTCRGQIVTGAELTEETRQITNQVGKVVITSPLEEERKRKKEEERLRREEAERELVAKRKAFAKAQQELLVQLGFTWAQSLAIVHIAGPASAREAVDYAYQFYKLESKRNSSPGDYKVVAFRVVGYLDQVMTPYVWAVPADIRRKMAEFGLPMPTGNFKQIIPGAKTALELSLPGKRRVYHHNKAGVREQTVAV